MKLPSVAGEVLGDVPSVLEVVHDVVEICGVIQIQRVTRFMQTSEVDNCVAQKWILHAFGRDADIDYVADGLAVKP